MSDRFRMVLRNKNGSQSATSLLRSRRTVVPPKKDDLSVLTWKEQQMIEKAQLASLKTSSQKAYFGKLKRSTKKERCCESSEDSDSSDTVSTESSIEGTSLHDRTSPLLLSPLPPIRSSRFRQAESKQSKANKSDKSISRRQSASRQSFCSTSSFPELLSPCSSTVATSSGFAARKSAYMGPIGSSDDEDGYCSKRRRNYFQSSDVAASDDDEYGPSCSSKHLPPVESMPSMEDFVSYLVLKGANCVPDHLKYIGNLQWETVTIKRKNNCGSHSTASAVVSMGSPSSGQKLEQAWAKKAIKRAKRSLTVKRNEKQGSPAKVSVSKNGKSRSMNTRPKATAAKSAKFQPYAQCERSSKGQRNDQQRGKDSKRNRPLTDSPIQLATFLRSKSNCHMAIKALEPDEAKQNSRYEFGLMSILFKPHNTGEIRLKSSNPFDYPIIDPRYLENDVDADILAKGLKVLVGLANSEELKKYDTKIVNKHVPGCEDHQFLSDEYLKCHARSTVTGDYHQVGTCRMGKKGQNSVVDERLRVHGVRNLRVVDASVFPYQIAANTNAACIMVGEKGADLIKEDYLATKE